MNPQSTITTLFLLIIAAARVSLDSTAAATADDNRNLLVRLYSIYRLHPFDAFDFSVVCPTDDGSDFCRNRLLSFVDSTTVANPQPNEFWYQHQRGPIAMQGAFWFRDQALGQSVLVSFAESRLGNGVATGVLGDNGVEDEFAMVLRPRGDHTWAFSGTEPQPLPASSFLNDIFDVLYKFELTGGTLEAPTSFRIVTEVKLGFNCIRLGVWKELWYLLAQWTMDLVTDTSDPTAQRYNRSAVWRRRTSFFLRLVTPSSSSFQYDAIQIVDGLGMPIQPAYDDFINSVVAEYGNRIFVYGLKEDRLDDYDSCWRPWWG